MSFTGADQAAHFGVFRSPQGNSASTCATLANAPAALLTGVV
jgi:hypothetical protein